jgi:hypothetical protein
MSMPGKHVRGIQGSVAKHGHTTGRRRSPEFTAWFSMLQRCEDENHPSFHNYGGRGIKVHPTLKSFEAFLKEVGERPSPECTLDRKDNERGYEPGNIRWATRSVQQKNRRTNRKLTFKGETKALVEWAEEYKIEPGTLSSRLRYGWSVKDALTTPLTKSGRPRKRPRRFSHTGEYS